MKKIKLLILITFVFILYGRLKAQSDSTITDTAAYVNQIITNNNKYTGKSFAVLEDDLKLPIKEIGGISGQYTDIEYVTFFFFSHYIFDPELKMPNHGFLIYWKKPYNNLDLSDSLSKGGSEWNTQTDSLYRSGTYIIDSIVPY